MFRLLLFICFVCLGYPTPLPGAIPDVVAQLMILGEIKYLYYYKELADCTARSTNTYSYLDYTPGYETGKCIELDYPGLNSAKVTCTNDVFRATLYNETKNCTGFEEVRNLDTTKLLTSGCYNSSDQDFTVWMYGTCGTPISGLSSDDYSRVDYWMPESANTTYDCSGSEYQRWYTKKGTGCNLVHGAQFKLECEGENELEYSVMDNDCGYTNYKVDLDKTTCTDMSNNLGKMWGKLNSCPPIPPTPTSPTTETSDELESVMFCWFLLVALMML